jgi:hypothetical protein
MHATHKQGYLELPSFLTLPIYQPPLLERNPSYASSAWNVKFTLPVEESRDGKHSSKLELSRNAKPSDLRAEEHPASLYRKKKISGRELVNEPQVDGRNDSVITSVPHQLRTSYPVSS